MIMKYRGTVSVLRIHFNFTVSALKNCITKAIFD